MSLRKLLTAARQWVPFSVMTCAYGTISLLLGPLSGGRASLWAMRQWCIASLRFLNIRVEFDGAENVPPEPFVYVCNHQSLLDVITLGSVLPRDYKWAAKSSLMKIPFLGWHLWLAGHVPVERGRGPVTAARMVDRFVGVLRRGRPLLVFPEGTRSPDGVMRAFKSGGFIAAARAGAPVAPVALEGGTRLLAKGAWHTSMDEVNVVRVRVGRPIPAPTEGSEVERAESLRASAYAAVRALHADLGGSLIAGEEAERRLG